MYKQPDADGPVDVCLQLRGYCHWPALTWKLDWCTRTEQPDIIYNFKPGDPDTDSVIEYTQAAGAMQCPSLKAASVPCGSWQSCTEQCSWARS